MPRTPIIEFKRSNPRLNLPSHLARKRGESNFAAAFEREFISCRTESGVGARYFPVFGYGIADFIWVDLYNARGADLENRTFSEELMLTAFELKLRDWKKALRQAYRYSYFANQSIVVLPPNIATANRNIDLFKILGIGLWTFDIKSAEICPIYQPKLAKPRNPNAKAKVISLFCRKTKFRKLCERQDTLFESL